MEPIFPSEQPGSSNTDLYDAIQVVSHKTFEAKKIKNKKISAGGPPDRPSILGTAVTGLLLKLF
jgi:hypothetical protein